MHPNGSHDRELEWLEALVHSALKRSAVDIFLGRRDHRNRTLVALAVAIALLILPAVFPEPTEFQRQTWVVGLCATMAVLLPSASGWLLLRLPAGIQAGGGIAIFFLLLFILL